MEVLLGIAVAALVVSDLLWRKAYNDREKDFEEERRELLTRILHPEIVPVPEKQLPPDAELLTADVEDEYELVGTIEPNRSDG